MRFTSQVLYTLIIALPILNTDAALAQSTQQSGGALERLQAEVFALRQGQAVMRNDLAVIKNDLVEIKRLLEQGAPATPPSAQQFKPADVKIGASAVLGDADATVTLIEYSDYQCPFCKRHATTVFPQLVKEYVDSGKLKIVMRENPIQSIHSLAMGASLAALCAAEQDKYWDMHDLMFTDDEQLEINNLKTHAKSLDMNVSTFNKCLDSKKYARQIRSDLAEASRLGVSGTPNFLMGLTDPDDSNKTRVTQHIRGAKDLASFQAAIDGLLASAE